MAVRNLDESDTLFAIEVDMENRSPEEIAKDAVLQINALFRIDAGRRAKLNRQSN